MNPDKWMEGSLEGSRVNPSGPVDVGQATEGGLDVPR